MWLDHPVSQKTHKLAAAIAGEVYTVVLPVQFMLALLARGWLSTGAVRLTLPAQLLMAQLWHDHPVSQQTHKLAAAIAGKMHLVVLPVQLLLAQLWPDHPLS